jgi:hypothetical protein
LFGCPRTPFAQSVRALPFHGGYFHPSPSGHETQYENLTVFRMKVAHDLLKIDLSDDRTLDRDRGCSFRYWQHAALRRFPFARDLQEIANQEGRNVHRRGKAL